MNMKELARLADVSSSAVSRYLNGGSLSQDKRERIHKAIEETGYHPDAAARMLRTRTTNYIGLIIPELDSDPVSQVAAGVSEALAKEGYLTLLANTHENPDAEIQYIRLFQEQKVAGIILMGTVFTPAHEEAIKASSVPVIVVGQQFRHIPCVYHDDYGAAFDLTCLIIKKGRKKPVYIGVTEKDAAVGRNRHRGVKDAMTYCGLDPSVLIYEQSVFSPEDGARAMQKILEKHTVFDAVICAADQIAIGACEILRQHHICIPEDVSLAAFDDEWFGDHLTPPLSSVHFYYKKAGSTAVDILMDLLHNKKAGGPVMQVMQGYKIMERASI